MIAPVRSRMSLKAEIINCSKNDTKIMVSYKQKEVIK